MFQPLKNITINIFTDDTKSQSQFQVMIIILIYVNWDLWTYKTIYYYISKFRINLVT